MVSVFGHLVKKGLYILDPIEGDTRPVVPANIREEVRQWLKDEGYIN